MIPNLRENQYGQLEAELSLPAWAGFQERKGPYNALSAEQASDGSCKLDVGGDRPDTHPTLREEHQKAYEYLVSHQETIRDRILDALLLYYHKSRDLYGYEEEELEAYMPEVKDREDFKKMIGLSHVHLLNVFREDMAYVGYEFGCTWEEEHGLGVMTHKDRIIDMGGADTSFMSWIAENDQKKKS